MNNKTTKTMARQDKWHAMCNAMNEYKKQVRQDLIEIGKELPLDNGYGEDGEPLVIKVVDDDGYGVYSYELDKARCDGSEYVEFHVVRLNENEQDFWIQGYMLGWDEIYAMENIKFPEDEDDEPND